MDKNQTLADSTRTRQALAAAISAGTAVNGSWLPLAACAGIAFFGSIGTANAGNNVAVRFSADGANPLGNAVGAQTSPGNGKSFGIVVHEIPPGVTHVRLEVTRAGANTTVDPWIAQEYGIVNRPGVSNVANEFTLNVVTRPTL